MKTKTLMKIFTFIFIFTFIVTLSFTLGFNVFADGEEETQEAVNTANKFIEWVKNLNMDDVRGWLIAGISYLSVNLGVIVVLVVKVLLNKAHEFKQSELHNAILEKMDAEHKKQIEELEEAHIKQLEDVKVECLKALKQSNKENLDQAKAETEKLQKSLEDIKLELNSED